MYSDFFYSKWPQHTVCVQGLEKSNHGSKIATVAWMIIFGDGVHNFIDGLSKAFKIVSR